MKTRITIMAVEKRQYPAKDGRPARDTQICQCFLPDGTSKDPKPLVAELRVAPELAVVEPGEWLAEFGLVRSWDSKEVGGGLVTLERIPAGARPGAQPTAKTAPAA